MPILAEKFGIRPWEMGDLTGREYQMISDYIKAQERKLTQAARRRHG